MNALCARTDLDPWHLWEKGEGVMVEGWRSWYLVVQVSTLSILVAQTSPSQEGKRHVMSHALSGKQRATLDYKSPMLVGPTQSPCCSTCSCAVSPGVTLKGCQPRARIELSARGDVRGEVWPTYTEQERDVSVLLQQEDIGIFVEPRIDLIYLLYPLAEVIVVALDSLSAVHA